MPIENKRRRFPPLLLRLDFKRSSACSAVAILILFAAAARTRLVSAYFLARSDRLFFDRLLTTAACAGYFGNPLSFNRLLVYSDLCGNDVLCRILTNGLDHFVEHIKAFHSVCGVRVVLTVASQIHAAAQFFHGVDVIHPL